MATAEENALCYFSLGRRTPEKPNYDNAEEISWNPARLAETLQVMNQIKQRIAAGFAKILPDLGGSDAFHNKDYVTAARYFREKGY